LAFAPVAGLAHPRRVKLCRFTSPSSPWPCVGLLTADDSAVLDLASAGITSLTALLERADLAAYLRRLAAGPLRALPLDSVRLLAPVEQQEVWAAGVTYLRSKKARMEESDFSASAYDRVYEAERPEIFFKAMPHKVVGPGGRVAIRADAKWNVPEPELALVLNSRGEVAGYTVGNDMSSRDIEGENLLYLPQAKVYDGSCALGPVIRVGVTEAEAREWTIRLRLTRGGAEVFAGETKVANIKRSFPELAGYLCRSQSFPHGAVLLTGTGVVPANDFTLAADDTVEITISGVGVLAGTVVVR
jgi:2-dehydro-3-deoxy-D-arabinonate dehydratase